MRLILLASAATLLGGAALAQSLLGQSAPGQSGSTPPAAIAVPPAPPVVAAPAVPVPVPVAPSPAPPPGLVQTPLPPPDSSASQDNGGNADNGGQTTQMQAVSPSAPAPVPVANGAASAPGTSQPPPVDQAPALSNDWVPAKTAVLGVLNKVDGSASTLTIPVGGQATAGDLVVGVQACVNRPAGQLPDSAVFLTLQPKDEQSGGQVYRGWMVRSTPGATDAGNAGQAFRVIACS